MTIAVSERITLAGFLLWEERQPLRYEFDGFQPVAMTGGTYAHDRIAINIAASLVSRLRGRPCQPSGPNMKIEVAGRIRYPDAFVVCTPVAPQSTVIRDPLVIFEVLSDGTANADLVEKNAEYRATPSVRRYVIVEQTHAAAIVFARKGEDWVSEIVAGAGAVLRLPEIGVEIPLAEFYADVTLEPRASEVEATPPDGA